MTRIVRLITVLTLLVALGVTGLLPAAGSWSCPDGTACVYSPERGFHCVDEPCSMPCCAARHVRHGCGHCGHGAIPGVTEAAGTRQRTAAEPDQCRYQSNQQLAPAALASKAAFGFLGFAAAILPAPSEPPVAARPWTRLAPIRGSPPSSAALPSSSPRAPPGPGCV